jgi:hypothetical protein
MQDKKIQCTTKSIKTTLLQGPRSWQNKTQLHLPHWLREQNSSDDTSAIAKLQNKMTFYSKLSLAINKAFLPKSVAIAQNAVDYLKGENSDYLEENLALEKNEVITCKFFFFWCLVHNSDHCFCMFPSLYYQCEHTNTYPS